MRVAIVQSSYIPWRGYFDLIDDVDVFIVHDDLQYTKGDWRNRNKIKTVNGIMWLSVPVHYRKHTQLIRDTEIDNRHRWQRKHIGAIQANYSAARYFRSYCEELFGLLEQRFATISTLNVALMRWVMEKLSIGTTMRWSEGLSPVGRKTDRLIDILQKVGATTYVSGPTAKGYLQTEKLAAAGIGLEFKSYVYPEYPQLWGPFEPAVTVLDLLFNCGGDARRYLKSGEPNEVVVVAAP